VIQEHFDAIHDRINSDTQLAGKGADTILYTTAGTPKAETYWVLAGGLDILDDARLTAGQYVDSDGVYTFRFTMVSPIATLARLGLQLAVAKLTDWAPSIEGRLCRVELNPGQVDAASTILPPLFYAQMDITVHSNRA
jgi:hypothetical protein